MKTQTHSPTPSASPSRHSANGSANPGSSPPWPGSGIASTQAMNVDRAPGLSVRLKLTLSYAGFLMLAGVLLLAVVWVFLLRYVPNPPAEFRDPGLTLIGPSRDDLVDAFAPKAAIALVFLLVFGLVGGWLL